MSLESQIRKNGMSVGLYEQNKFNVQLDEYMRDMRRLTDLRKQSATEGLNTYEGNERDSLLEKYDIDHLEWWQKRFLND